jgi:tyrosyl-tRNA synthetase
MKTDEKLALVRRNTQEIVNEKELKDLLKKKKRPTAYIGFAPTGKIHVGYFVPLKKVADFIKAGFDFTILIADLHAHLDDVKTPWDLLDARSKYYEACIKAILQAYGADIKKLKFVKGSNVQLTPKYFEEVLRMVSMVTLKRTKRAASEVVRFGEEPKLGGFVYPLMQIEDIPALKADVAFGGIDQRGIYMLGRELLPLLKYNKPICVFAPLLPGLTGGKMSASVEESKIDILDSEKEVERKVRKAFCPEKKVEDNGVLAFIKHVIMPDLLDKGKPFVIERPAKFGGIVKFDSYTSLENAYKKGKVHPADLKAGAGAALNALMIPIRKKGKNIEKLMKSAYP